MSININNGIDSIKIILNEIVKEKLSQQNFVQKKILSNKIFTGFNYKKNKNIIKQNKNQNFLNKEEKSSQKKISIFSKEGSQIKSSPPKNRNSIFKKNEKIKKNLNNNCLNKINKCYKY